MSLTMQLLATTWSHYRNYALRDASTETCKIELIMRMVNVRKHEFPHSVSLLRVSSEVRELIPIFFNFIARRLASSNACVCKKMLTYAPCGKIIINSFPVCLKFRRCALVLIISLKIMCFNPFPDLK